MNLAGQVAVVTGASRGIGRAVALKLAEAGADLSLWATSAERLVTVAAQIEAAGRKASARVVRVEDGEAVSEAMKATLTEHGHVDILINNAGITRDGLLLRMKEADWTEVLGINLTGAYHCTRAVLRSMVQQKSGRIVNIASVGGLVGNAGQANYAASKAGLVGFTKSVAREVASRGITVNAVAPGLIETDMAAGLSPAVREHYLKTIPLARLGTAEEVAEAVLFLVSHGSYITGQVVVVDGGLAM